MPSLPDGVDLKQGKAECRYCYLQRIVKQLDNAGIRYRLLRTRASRLPLKGFDLIVDRKKILCICKVPNRCICK